MAKKITKICFGKKKLTKIRIFEQILFWQKNVDQNLFRQQQKVDQNLFWQKKN